MSANRSAQLDAMTEADKEAELLRALAEHGVFRLESAQAVAYWGAAVDRLIAAGKASSGLIENTEGQYSFIQVTRAVPKVNRSAAPPA